VYIDFVAIKGTSVPGRINWQWEQLLVNKLDASAATGEEIMRTSTSN
jgi:hypothetical protein